MGNVYVDGRLVPADEAKVSVFDHGFVVGDGVFESVLVREGRPFALRRHLDRLQRSASGLGIEPPSRQQLEDAVRAVLADVTAPLAGLRLTVTAGLGPLGSPRGESGPTVVVAASPVGTRSGPQMVLVVPWLRNERGALAGLKTTSYAENARALAQARREGADEAVFANTAGNLCEGTGSNVFVVVDGRLITPPLSAGCLAGVTRDLVLESSEASEADLPISRFTAAGVEEAFLTSTMREVAPIHTINGEALPACPGPLTAAARESFEKLAAAGDEP